MLRDYFRIAFRNIRKRRLRSWLTVVGILIGITAVVGLISLGQGMQQAIGEQFMSLGADKLTVMTKGPHYGPPGTNTNITLTKGDFNVVKRSNGVRIAAGRLIEPVTVEFNDKKLFTFLGTIPDDDINERKIVSEVIKFNKVVDGRVLKKYDQNKIMVSAFYMTPRFDGKPLKAGDKLLINGKGVDVVGVFKKTGNPILDRAIIMNEKPARNLLGIDDRYGIIIAKADPKVPVSVVASNIEKNLRSYRNVDEGREDFEVQTAEEILDTLGSVLNIVTAVLVGIAAISLLVGGIGIMNTMYTSVLERRREIGIMKAIGARNRDVMIIFLIESGLLGLSGGIIGLFLGVALGKLVEKIAAVALGTVLIQASFPPYLIIGSLLFSFFVGSVAGVTPARQASLMNPVDALRD